MHWMLSSVGFIAINIDPDGNEPSSINAAIRAAAVRINQKPRKCWVLGLIRNSHVQYDSLTVDLVKTRTQAMAIGAKIAVLTPGDEVSLGCSTHELRDESHNTITLTYTGAVLRTCMPHPRPVQLPAVCGPIVKFKLSGEASEGVAAEVAGGDIKEEAADPKGLKVEPSAEDNGTL